MGKSAVICRFPVHQFSEWINVELVHTAPSLIDMYSDCMVFASAALSFHNRELKLRAREKEPNSHHCCLYFVTW